MVLGSAEKVPTAKGHRLSLVFWARINSGSGVASILGGDVDGFARAGQRPKKPCWEREWNDRRCCTTCSSCSRDSFRRVHDRAAA
jgi:hypothetical protein